MPAKKKVGRPAKKKRVGRPAKATTKNKARVTKKAPAQKARRVSKRAAAASTSHKMASVADERLEVAERLAKASLEMVMTVEKLCRRVAAAEEGQRNFALQLQHVYNLTDADKMLSPERQEEAGIQLRAEKKKRAVGRRKRSPKGAPSMDTVVENIPSFVIEEVDRAEARAD